MQLGGILLRIRSEACRNSQDNSRNRCYRGRWRTARSFGGSHAEGFWALRFGPCGAVCEISGICRKFDLSPRYRLANRTFQGADRRTIGEPFNPMSIDSPSLLYRASPLRSEIGIIQRPLSPT